jgi:hypothetical protein
LFAAIASSLTSMAARRFGEGARGRKGWREREGRGAGMGAAAWRVGIRFGGKS